jgi:hypothetical protein
VQLARSVWNVKAVPSQDPSTVSVAFYTGKDGVQRIALVERRPS